MAPLLVLALTGVAQADSGYVTPFPNPDYLVGRTDMGVDVCMAPGDPIDAVGDGVVVGIIRNWFRHEPYIWYQLTDGPDAGRYVYVAEQITHLAHIGQTLRAGQRVATFAKRGTCIETGWSAADGATWAQATTGYYEGEITPAGVSFARFLIARGVQGSFELNSPIGHASKAHHRKHKKHKKHKAHTPAPTSGGSSSPSGNGGWQGPTSSPSWWGSGSSDGGWNS